MQTEGVQHLGRAVKGNSRTLLPNRHRRQEDRHDPVLAERQTIFRMTGDLQNELSIAAFVQELICRQSADRQTTENQRPPGKTEALIALIAAPGALPAARRTLDAKGLPVAGVETAKKLVDESLPSNGLMKKWADSASR